jgi:regulator of sirC expression with transglutaminase-like and TPR domain
VSPAEIRYVTQVLQHKKSLLKALGPATEDRALALRQIQAIDAAIEDLQRTRFVINPFI